MNVVRPTLRLVALALAVAAAVVVVLPLHATGVSGSAVSPRYHDFYYATYEAVPGHSSTADDLRRAGIQLPGVVVRHRRDLGWGLGLAGVAAVVALGVDEVLRRRRRPVDAVTAARAG